MARLAHALPLGLALACSALACSTPAPDPAGLYCLGGAARRAPLGQARGASLDSVVEGATGADVRLVAGPSYEISICARVGAAGEGGARPVRLDVEGRPTSGGAVTPEAQELHCEGEARRDGSRLVVDAPRCCEGEGCLALEDGPCVYEARPIALSIRSDAIALEPFRVRRSPARPEEEPCGERTTLGVRVGAERLTRATER